MLDTSGSIGSNDFKRMKDTITLLIPDFCNAIQVAVMKFSHNVYLEFCFNCFDNDIEGRDNLVKVIKRIEYLGGATSTGVAAKCVYKKLFDLNFGCGIHPASNCIDVVFITDGKSNGPLRYPKVCEQINCLRSHRAYGYRTRVYAIAIGDDVLQEEIDCITGGDRQSVFNVRNFEQFFQLAKSINEDIHVKKTVECVYLNGTLMNRKLVA